MDSHIALVGTPLTLDPAEYPCRCVANHNPNVRRTHRHHIVPLAWDGPNTADNIMPLCPTAHDEVHYLLWLWDTGRQEPGTYPYRARPFIRDLCERAWAGHMWSPSGG